MPTEFNSVSASEVLVFGGANVDVFACPSRRMRRGDSTPGRIWEAAGGVGRNIAANLARLGHAVRLLSVVGNDPRGDWLLRQTRRAGVDVGAVERHASLPTACYVAITDATGGTDRAIADMRIFDRFAVPGDGEGPAIKRYRALVIDCNPPRAAIAAVLREAAENGVPVFVDGVSAAKVGRIEHCLERIHTLKINRAECIALTAVDGADPDWPRRAEDKLLRAGVRRVVISMGAAGVRYADARCRIASSVEVDASGNDTGAGDALTAGLVSAWLRNLDTERQLGFALGCAAFTLNSDQAVHPELSIARVDQWVSRNS